MKTYKLLKHTYIGFSPNGPYSGKIISKWNNGYALFIKSLNFTIRIWNSLPNQL